MDSVLVQSRSLDYSAMNHRELTDGDTQFQEPQRLVPYVAIPLKRSLEDYADNTRPTTAQSDHKSAMDQTGRPKSPALSVISSELSSVTATPPPFNVLNGPTATGPAPKRRKLTSAEKAENEREKAEKKANREKERAAREDQKRVKDEERRQKNEEAEEKRRERDLKKHEKDLKKQQEEEEKARKERAQSRINAFFAKPKPAHSTPAGMIELEDSAISSVQPASSSATPQKQASASDYYRTFLPFELPSSSSLAPHNRFSWDSAATQHALGNADTLFSGTTSFSPQSLADTLDLSPWETEPRGAMIETTSTIFSERDGTASNPLDLEHTETTPRQSLRDRLKRLPMKYIEFHEDVRPPYIGTMSKGEPSHEKLRIGRRPFHKAKEDLDYEYDSEAEWEEPEEGEDLESEGEEDSESVGDAEELDEFLDDEGIDDAQKLRKKLLTGDMQPVSTGLCWENAVGLLSHDTSASSQNPRQYRMERLIDADFPIDPFADSYWSDAANGPHTSSIAPVVAESGTNLVRPPLQARPNITINGLGKSAKPGKPSKPKRALSEPEFEDFKQAVQGSDLNKAGMLAVLKKRLPKVPNAVLSEALGTYAARVGVKEADKKWVVLNSASS